MIASESHHAMQTSTIAVCILFGTNAILYFIFYCVSYRNKQYLASISDANANDNITTIAGVGAVVAANKETKTLSDPFTGTLECFTKLTSELLRLSAILALTYICENNWIFEHSSKSYSRDLFIFVILIFFIYAFYTIKPCHDLTLLSREQTEEWKGWMQFIFLLYHYFHAEEVYNSVRVMITCYVWMTGFGNFSFFYIKQDYGWLRVVQMVWRLNFSVLLLMWTHGNTYILYYICPMHTFYFFMVYMTMYVYSNVNHSKWGIRVKLMILGIIIYVLWDVNNGLFDFIFQWLGTDSVIGAGSGSVWEYYFRTSLDHYSSFLGMIFAVNFPLAEQFFYKAKGYPLVVASILMAIVSFYWFTNFYMLDKMEYNLTHSYTAIIPLTAYIFFRNITPYVRSGVSMSLHELGKTTLETYLLQHHVWLTSNAKTLLTIVPGHPWINFALCTMLFFFASKELYRLTMSLRGMMLPDNPTTSIYNMIGMTVVVTIVFAISYILNAFSAVSLIIVIMICCLLALVTILIVNRFCRQVADHTSYQYVSHKAVCVITVVLVFNLVLSFIYHSYNSSSDAAAAVSGISNPSDWTVNQSNCIHSVSEGSWVKTICDTSKPPSLSKSAYCQTLKWVWSDSNSQKLQCPIGYFTVDKARDVFRNKRILFIGDSVVRNTYHAFQRILDPLYDDLTYANNSNKHGNLQIPSAITSPSMNVSVSFIWAPMIHNVSSVLLMPETMSSYDLVVSGALLWDALHIRDIGAYTSSVLSLVSASNRPVGRKKAISVWLQPTKVIDGRLNTDEKQQYMTSKQIELYKKAIQSTVPTSTDIDAMFNAIIDPYKASDRREDGSVDGIHYSNEVYTVVGQMIANAYALHYPIYYNTKASASSKKTYIPKVTGSMSFPGYGLVVLLLSAVMLFTMDSWLGLGYVSLKLFRRSYSWEEAYAPLLHKLGLGNSGSSSSNGKDSYRSVSVSEVSELLSQSSADNEL